MNWRSYAQLVRLPNLPTALADIGLAGLATGLLLSRWPAFLLLLGASACLYMAGMVFNDYFDIEQDRRERPDRPIPSGAVSARHAALLGAFLLTAGVGLAAVAGFVLQRTPTPACSCRPRWRCCSPPPSCSTTPG